MVDLGTYYEKGDETKPVEVVLSDETIVVFLESGKYTVLEEADFLSRYTSQPIPPDPSKAYKDKLTELENWVGIQEDPRGVLLVAELSGLIEDYIKDQKAK